MELRVDLDAHHLEELTARPVTGLTELIWNGLDADASRVEVQLATGDMGGVDEIRVIDNGHGMTAAEAEKAFATLGGSWKLHADATRSGDRVLHGKHGRGRFRAAGIGQGVSWNSVAEQPDGSRARIRIEVRAEDLGRVEISEPEPTEDPTGTRVVIFGIADHPEGVGTQTWDRLLAQFAIYIEQYGPEIVFDGQRLDPTELQVQRESYDLSVEGTARVDVIEWNRPFDRALYLCSIGGMALHQVPPGIQAPGFNFTAYLRWSGFEEEGRALMAELDGAAGDVIEEAREALRVHFRERANDEVRTQVAAWKDEQVYPFDEEPGDAAEEAAQELFDVVAVTARDAVNTADTQGRKFSLGLLRQAIEQDPGSLHRVLQEVLELPEESLEELDALLRQTNLTQVIRASRSITNRLDFLKALDEMVHDPEVKKRVLERTQLHKILANETWVFGEEYTLGVDDQALRAVLERHIEILGRNELTPELLAEPMEAAGEREQAIVDLMLYRAIPQGTKSREHLVVELKRPAVDIGPAEAQQIKDYAHAVSKDDRFDKSDVAWDFLVIGTALKGTVLEEASQQNRPQGLLSTFRRGTVRVWAKTWGQLLDDATHRHKFVQKNLGYDPSTQEAYAYLHRVHSGVIPEVIADAVSAEDSGRSDLSDDPGPDV